MGNTPKNARSDDKRGLASADQKTKERVAKMGGTAFHEKRGAKGSDSRKPDE